MSDPKQEREGLSLDNQEQALRRYSEDSEIHIAREFRFQESADHKIRKRFHEMLSYVKTHRDVTAIIGYRVDRMTRNFHDHVLLDELRLNHGKELHFVHDRLVINRETVGKDIQDWDTKVFLAKMYLNRLKEDAVVSASFKLSRGEWPGKAPFGYRNVRVNERSKVIPDEKRSAIVREIFELYGTGAYSMEQVRGLVESRTGIMVHVSKIDHVLKNPFYFGEMRYNGRQCAHIYEPIITRSLFERVQNVKASFHKKRYKYAGLPFLYRGLIRCGVCGCLLSPELKRKESGREYVYYHCTEYHGKHGADWIREEDLTNQFRLIFDGLRWPEDTLQTTLAALREAHITRASTESAALARLSAERSKLERRGALLYEDRLDGLIGKDLFIERKEKADADLRRINALLKEEHASKDSYYLNAATLLEVCAKAGALFEAAGSEERRIILNELLQNCEFQEKRLLWELKQPFKAVFSQPSHPIWLPLTDALLHREIELNVNLNQINAILGRPHQ